VAVAEGRPRVDDYIAMRNFFKNNGLSVVLFGLFFIFLAGQAVTGWSEYNSNQQEHHSPQVGFPKYLTTGHFGEAVFENWESEFLQMSSYVFLTIWLRQRGSSESKAMSGSQEVDRDPRNTSKTRAPGAVRQGGWMLDLYENSLGLVFALLFFASLFMHAVEGTRTYNQDQREHHSATVSVEQYARTSRFWFESFQNWQSEFLATGCLVLFSVYLRQRGSPESKPVDMAHDEMEDS
jgi:Domain of unknown function (DUF6766)